MVEEVGVARMVEEDPWVMMTVLGVFEILGELTRRVAISLISLVYSSLSLLISLSFHH